MFAMNTFVQKLTGLVNALLCVSAGAKRHIDKQDGDSISNNQTTFVNIPGMLRQSELRYGNR